MKPNAAYLAIISDLILWSVLILLIIAAGWAVQDWYYGARHHRQTITLYFEDASQLKVGSPVHFMGVDVGNVTKVAPAGDKVRVQVKTDPKVIEIPKGSRFTIQFNGMAGAKTMEVLPPLPHEKDLPHYIAEEPFRMREVMRSQMVFNQALESAADNTFKTLGYLEDEEDLLRHLAGINQDLLEVDRTLVYVAALMQDQKDVLHEALHSGAMQIQDVNRYLGHWEVATQPETVYHNTKATMRYVTFWTEDINAYLQEAKDQGKIEMLRQNLAKLHFTSSKLNNEIGTGLTDLLKWLEKTQQSVTQLENTLPQRPLTEDLQTIKEKSKTWSEQSKDLSDQI